MSDKTLHPICAFDIGPDGQAVLLEEPWPDAASAISDGYRWLHFDLTDPALEAWTDEKLPPVAAYALRQSETRPRCDVFEDGVLLNLRGVNLNPGNDPEDMVSLRLWVRPGLIVTARLRKLWAVDALRKAIDAGKAPVAIADFLNLLTYELSKRIERVSLDLEEETDALEEKLLGESSGLSGELVILRQSVIKLRRFVRPQCEALNDLSQWQSALLDQGHSDLLRETANRATRTIEALDAISERLTAMQDHLETRHASALGRNSYILSVAAAIFLPLGFLTGLFGINVGGMPGVDSPYGFAVVTIASCVIGVLLFVVFRLRKWL
ncbi:zinc transporter ZntB [Denitrobaculum tricleocarpae]|uniref:Zinc transporter ZntB n=1 Tax=Denitrobaculum tricleocarpae TaxID=2591009 RepID=A0A545U2V9_9PROT|nr:zinc transporter ZntB [Denitrobaculum tricleocarpae]TQV83764.1 zinc transporter ZntB [Denitrobaculum tricleocarpae]